MLINLGTLSSMATTLAGGRLDWSPSEASFWVNQAYGEVGTRVGYTTLEALATSSTTSGENKIALPPDFHRGIALTLYQGSNSTGTQSNATITVALNQKDPRWMDAQSLSDSGGASTAGVPEAYIQYATWFELWPSPNSAYSLQLRYYAKPGTLVASTDTPNLDERWHVAVLYKSVELLEASRNNVEGEMLARNRYLSYMVSTPSDAALKMKDRTGMGMRFARDNT